MCIYILVIVTTKHLCNDDKNKIIHVRVVSKFLELNYSLIGSHENASFDGSNSIYNHTEIIEHSVHIFNSCTYTLC